MGATSCVYLELYRKYSGVLKEYAELGEMELVTNVDDLQPNQGYFLPHHCVIKESSSSTKLRVVFNASQHTDQGLSLNDLLHSGPKLQTELAKVILRWRMYPVVFTAGIKKMFRRIGIHPEDQRFQKILWRESLDQEVRAYYLKTVTFGFASSPYLAIRTLLQLAEDEGDKYPLATEILKREIYVDDVLSGGDDVDQAREKRRQVDLLLQAGGFTLKKWVSNKEEVLRGMPIEHREDATSFLFKQDSSFRALGILWQPSLDCLRFQIDSLSEMSQITKREVFSEIARIFDPLGWLAPVIVKAKIFMQSLRAIKIGWDNTLPAEFIDKWTIFRDELSDLTTLTIPRWLGSTSSDYCELHGFGDTSEKAIGAVVYLRVTLPSSSITRVTLVTAKTKVDRLKETSIPRLELCAAVLLVRSVSHVRSVLSLFASTPIHLWSNSENTLNWIGGHPLRWKTYTTNRVSEIQHTLPEAVWHHVPGVDNPAVCASRGLTPIRLEHHLIWWQGPVWLAKLELFWPRSAGIIDPLVDKEERVIAHSALVAQEPPWGLLTKYSSLTKLIRITALCLRFMDRLRKKHFERPPCHPTTAYLKLALKRLIGYIQRENFSEDLIKVTKKLDIPKSSPLLKLLPFLDTDGLLRLEGRLTHAVLDYDERCPYILPKDSPLTTLIIRNGHQFILHGGP